ncbi:MAG: plasmid pRiA4b ORF-3 family protein [Clostridium sp.]|nr:plasmid pRiA4b ORF-3 family protein [Clostridium sp.]
MIHKFILISPETEDFVCELLIDADATFHDLHRLILQTCGYTDDQMTSFFLCNANWEKEQEIVLEDMGQSTSDEDLLVMKDTRLGDMLEDEKQHVAYVFDPFNERVLLLELSEIIFGKHQETPVCNRRHGEAPAQTADIATDTAETSLGRKAEEIDENFYGSEGFEDEEFDPEGFEISDGNPYD